MSGRRDDDADEMNARIDQNLDAIEAMLNEMDGVTARRRHPAIRLVSSDSSGDQPSRATRAAR